jgi:hypothetical protein
MGRAYKFMGAPFVVYRINNNKLTWFEPFYTKATEGNFFAIIMRIKAKKRERSERKIRVKFAWSSYKVPVSSD